MEKDSRFVGLDVHAATIVAAVAEPGSEVRALGTIPNTPEAIRRLVKKLGAAPAGLLRSRADGLRALPPAHPARGAL